MAGIAGTLSGRWARVVEALRPDLGNALLAVLEEEYRDEVVAAERMAEDATGVRADFLRRKLEGIAESEREHAQALRQAIVRLGGVPPGPVSPPAQPRPGRTFQRLLEDLEEEKREPAGYLRAVALARRAGAEEVELSRRMSGADRGRESRTQP